MEKQPDKRLNILQLVFLIILKGFQIAQMGNIFSSEFTYGKQKN